MIIGEKTTGWPVPGFNFGGRQVFIQVRPGDQEKQLGDFSATMCCAVKLFAELLKAPNTPHHKLMVLDRWLEIWESLGIDITHSVETNIKPLMKRQIDG